MRRRTGDRRLVLAADLDRHDASRALWPSDDAVDSRAAAIAVAVRAAIESDLTEKQREVVEAYFFEGVSQGEIARRLGVSQQVVQKRLFGAPRREKLVGGAIARLRRALAPLVASMTSTEAGS